MAAANEEVQVPADELRQLLHPLSPEEFLACYWDKEAVHIPGARDKFSQLFDRRRFLSAAARGESLGTTIRVSFDSERDPGSVGTHLPIRATEIEDYLRRGASVCVDPIEIGDPELAGFAGRIAAQLHYAGATSVKAYYSADGCGFNTHFDKGIATTLQIEGQKRWRFTPTAAVAFPRGNALLGPDGTIRYVDRLASNLEPWERPGKVAPEELREVVLEPGDILFLPAGSWHSAKAIGRSLALNLSFQPLLCLPFITSLLEPLLAARPEWRRGLPLALHATAPAQRLPPEVERFLAGRLAELAALAGELDAAGPRVYKAWRRAVEGLADPSAGGTPAFTLHSRPPQQAEKAKPPAEAPATAGAERAAAGGPAREYSGKLTCTICVGNLGEAIAWYASVLGFSVLYRADAFSWCELATPIPGVTVGLSEVVEAERRGGVVLNFGVQDLDAMRQRMEASGVSFEGPTQVIQGFVKLAPFVDPDGNRLLLSQAL